MAKQLKITQIRSSIRYPEREKVTLKTLGLRKIRQAVFQPDNPQIRGMIEKVKHLIEVEEVREKKTSA